jgi:hypothetical protein
MNCCDRRTGKLKKGQKYSDREAENCCVATNNCDCEIDKMSAVANCSNETERVCSGRDIEEKISDMFVDSGYWNKSDWSSCMEGETYRISNVAKCSEREAEEK